MDKGSGVNKAIIYYTDNTVPAYIGDVVQRQLLKPGIPILSISHKPMDFGQNICVGDVGRSKASMTLQVLLGLYNADADIIFLAEHDVLYHPSHFDFVPVDSNTLYFNHNFWRVNAKTGFNFKSGHHGAKSQVCAMRKCLYDRFEERLDYMVNGKPLSGLQGYHWYTKKPPSISPVFKFDRWFSKYGNIDIRHGGNISGNRKFSKKRTKPIPGWGITAGRFKEFLLELA